MINQIPGLKPEVNSKLCKFYSYQPSIERAILYGSRANGTHRPYSNVDITLTGNDVNLDVLNKVSRRIDELNFPWIFDLSAKRQISNPDLKKHIERVGMEIYEREDLSEQPEAAENINA